MNLRMRGLRLVVRFVMERVSPAEKVYILQTEVAGYTLVVKSCFPSSSASRSRSLAARACLHVNI